jgi:hypothetical protein
VKDARKQKWHSSSLSVHQHVELAEERDRPVDRVPDCIGVGSVRLDRNRLSASAFYLFDKGRRCVRAFGDRGADAARTAGDKRDLACQWSGGRSPVPPVVGMLRTSRRETTGACVR